MNKYDVIIIGGGIGGLVCGCYLSKAGLRVLIVEKNEKVGGYCTSFSNNGFMFDACVHSLGSCRKNGIIREVCDELGIDNRMELVRHSPSDIIISPGYLSSFYSSLDQTIHGFIKNFPKSKNKIQQFFYFLNQTDSSSAFSLRKKTFGEILDNYFSNNKLKSILSFPILGNAGLPPSLISAFTGTMLYKEFMIDGGYYPKQGIQAFSDSFAKRFKEFGGELLLSNIVKKIRVKHNRILGIELENQKFISSKYVVSACDAIQTFTQLLNIKTIGNEFREQLLRMRPSLSMYILYLGFNKKIELNFPTCSNIWYLPKYDIDDLFKKALKRNATNISEFMIRFSSDKKNLTAFLISSFKNKNFWDRQKNNIALTFINKIEKIVPSLSRYIVYRNIATPYSLFKWTLNYKGANYGWSSLPSQIMQTQFLKIRFLQNFYISGHWSTLGHGLRGALYSGIVSAKHILKNSR